MRSLLALLFLGVVGCGPAARGRGPSTPTPTQSFELEPMRIEAVRGPDGQTHVVAFDAASLFEEANAALDAGDPATALSRYDQLLAAFPTSVLAPAARFRWLNVLDFMGRVSARTVPAAISAFPRCHW